MNAKPRGRQFFNNPGPTNIPDRVLRAMDRPVLDFMSDEFLAIQHACHAGVKRVLKTDQTLYMYTASGHGAWEAAIANLFSPGETVLMVETGYFSQSWTDIRMDTSTGVFNGGRTAVWGFQRSSSSRPGRGLLIKASGSVMSEMMEPSTCAANAPSRIREPV